jgi:hypothetical protein
MTSARSKEQAAPRVHRASQCAQRYRLLIAVSVALRQRAKATIMLCQAEDTPHLKRASEAFQEASRRWLAARSAYDGHKRAHKC